VSERFADHDESERRISVGRQGKSVRPYSVTTVDGVYAGARPTSQADIDRRKSGCQLVQGRERVVNNIENKVIVAEFNDRLRTGGHVPPVDLLFRCG